MRRWVLVFSCLVLIVTSGAPAWCDDVRETGYISPQVTDTGARLVFNWNSRSKVRFTPQVKGNKVTLNFNKPVDLKWDQVLQSMDYMLKQVESRDGGKTVVLTLNHPAEARRFLLYGRDGVDFSRNGVEIKTNVPLIADYQDIPVKRSTGKKQTAKKRAPAKKTKLARKEPPVTTVSTLANDLAAMAALAPAAGTGENRVAGNDTINAVVAPPPEAAATEPASSKPPARQDPPTDNDLGGIILPLLADDPFVIVSRGPNLWIAADNSIKLSSETLKSQNKDFSYPVSAIPAENGTILQVTLDKEMYPSLYKNKDGKIILRLEEKFSPPDKSLIPSLAVQDEKNLITLEAAKTGKILTTTDPQTGETLQLVPVAGAGSGVETAQAFVEFSLPQTAQGVVVQKIADDLSVSTGDNKVAITSSKGLAISAEFKKQLEDTRTATLSRKIPPVLFPYALWKLEDPKQFVPLQKELFRTIYSSPPAQANEARLKLLQLFLSEGLFAEANGMANDILRSSYKFYSEKKVSAMRGAANFFRQRYSEAEKDFLSEELADIPEAKMWLQLISTASKPSEPFDFNRSYQNYIAYYPPTFIQKIALIVSDQKVAAADYDAASEIFLALQKEGLDEPIKKYFDYLRARIQSEVGNSDEAAKTWERQAADVNDRLIRAKAEFSLVNMYLKEERIPIEDAAKRLEKLRIVWRGDALELNVLTLLGNLYLEEKDYARALRAWRDIVAYYSEMPDAITTARKMQSVFVRLFNKGAADELPALTSLSLFYEFRDLVPTGIEGDLMIRNLAERLVRMDLLDRASQLLSHQIRNRLQGPERSRVGARLAEIYLMNRQPKQALEILKISGYGELTPEVQLSRIRLTAQALAQQGQLGKAIEVLSSDTSAEGNLLRLSVYWTNWDWPNVVTMAEEILSNRNDPSAPLTLQESEVLLKLATAYVYEQDSGQIQYLRDYFTPLLKDNPNKESFLFITSESGNIDYNNLANLDKDINTVKSFIDNSRKEAAGKSSATSSALTPTPQPVRAVN